MGVSFVISRKGKRYRPNSQSQQTEEDNNKKEDEEGNNNRNNTSSDDALVVEKDQHAAETGKNADHGNETSNSRIHTVYKGMKVSVRLNLFPNGFSVGRNCQNHLLPYDRAAEELFTAIESGRLPGDMFDDLPCKYYNGTMLCEVRDYRPCCTSGEVITSSTERSPIIHKVPLKMSMENVIKDLASISDATWTYRDLLEAESRILRALHPDLNVNPEPQLDRIFGAPLRRKVDLGITWSWKKRKLNESPSVDLIGKGLPTSQALVVSDVDRYSSQARQAGIGVSPVSTGSSAAIDSMPSCTPVVVTNSQLDDNCSKSIANSLLTSIPASTSQKEISEIYPGTLSSLVLGKRDRSGARTSTRIHNEHRKDNVGHSKLESVYRQVESAQMSILPRKSNQTAEKNRVDKAVHGRFHLKDSPSINNIEGPVCEGNPEQFIVVPICVKQETDQASNFCSSDQGSDVERGFLMQTGSVQSMPQESQLRQPSTLLRASSLRMPPTLSLQGIKSRPVKKKQQNKIVEETMNVHRIQQVLSFESTPSSSHTALPTEPPQSDIPTYNAHAKSLNSVILNSLVGSDSQNAANRSSNSLAESGNLNEENRSSNSLANSSVSSANSDTLLMRNLHLAQPAEIAVGPTLNRLSKIISVNQRHQHKNKERKMNQIPQRKSFLLPNPLIAFHLLGYGDYRGSKNASADGQLLSGSFVDKKVNVAKTRTLIFVLMPYVLSGNTNPIVNSDLQVKVVMLENPNEDLVEAKVLYFHKEEIESNSSYVLPNFSSLQAADLFASQFKSLMLNEGYCLLSDKLDTIPLHSYVGNMSQELFLGTNPSISAATNYLSLEPSVPRLLPYMSNSMSKSRLAFDMRQLQGQGALSGAGSLPSGDVQSPLLFSSSNISKFQLGFAAEENTRYQQAQFRQNFGGNMQMDQEVGFGSSSNRAVMPSSVSRYTHSVGRSNNLPNDIPVLGASNQPHVATSGFRAEDFARLKHSEGLRRGLTRGFSHPGFLSSGIQMDMPNILNMPSYSNNLQQQQLQGYQQSPRQLQQSMLSPPMAAHLAMLGNPHPSQVGLQQTNQQPQLSPLQQQLSSFAGQMDTGSNRLLPERLGMNSGNHMRVGRDSASSSTNRSGSGREVRSMKPHGSV